MTLVNRTKRQPSESQGLRFGFLGVSICMTACIWMQLGSVGSAQPPSIRYGDRTSPEVKMIYDRGLKYLNAAQQADGSWAGGQKGGGVTGLCLMAFLASGEDPNFGQYGLNVRKAIRNIINSLLYLIH